MKKIITVLLCAALLCSCALTLTSCGEKKEFVSVAAADLVQEDFGIAVTKENDALLTAVNAVVDAWVLDGTMAAYVEYYTALAEYSENGGEAPNAGDLTVAWDFGNATETVTVYTESGFAPFEFLLDGEVVGVDIAIANEVAKNLGKKVEIMDVEFSTIPLSVKTAEGDAIGAAGITINEDRLETVDFSSVYFSSTVVIVSEKDKAYASVKDLSGLRVGVQEGTSADIILTDAKTAEGYQIFDENDALVSTVLVDADTQVSAYSKYAYALADLKNGKIDAILMDKLPAESMLATLDN